jgi:hypothetical protein
LLVDAPPYLLRWGIFLVLVLIVLIDITKSVLGISALTKIAMNRIEWGTKLLKKGSEK